MIRSVCVGQHPRFEVNRLHRRPVQVFLAVRPACCAQQTGMHIGCGSTAYSVGTVYGGKGHLYTPGVCPVLLATPCLAPLAITLLFKLVTPC